MQNLFIGFYIMINNRFNDLTTRGWFWFFALVIFSVLASMLATIKIALLFNFEYKQILLPIIYIIGVIIFTSIIIFIFNFLSSKDSPTVINQHYTQAGNSASNSQTETDPKQLDCIYAREYRARLQNHIDKIRDNSVINLLTGLVISALGVVFIFFYHEDNEYISKLKDNIAPFYFFSKFFAVLFIELLAFFFLRLYKQNHNDIKYFQNELANIDSKLIALNFSLRSENHKVFSYVLRQLAKTDRNHIIKSGESTIELERMKIERNDYQSLRDLIAHILKSNSGTSSKDAS